MARKSSGLKMPDKWERDARGRFAKKGTGVNRTGVPAAPAAASRPQLSAGPRLSKRTPAKAAPPSASDVAARLRGEAGGGEAAVLAALADVKAGDVKTIADELNITIPSAVRSAAARKKYLADTLAAHHRRTGGRSSAVPPGRARADLAAKSAKASRPRSPEQQQADLQDRAAAAISAAFARVLGGGAAPAQPKAAPRAAAPAQPKPRRGKPRTATTIAGGERTPTTVPTRQRRGIAEHITSAFGSGRHGGQVTVERWKRGVWSREDARIHERYGTGRFGKRIKVEGGWHRPVVEPAGWKLAGYKLTPRTEGT